MKCCRHCEDSLSCRIPDEINRLKRIQTILHERGSNPWLQSRIGQYLAMEVCLSSLFGLAELHEKAASLGVTSDLPLQHQPRVAA